MTHPEEKSPGLGTQDQGGDEAIRNTDTQRGTIEVLTAGIQEKTQHAQHDEAANLFDGEEGVFEYTQDEARKVLWKMDLILLPMVCG